MISIIIMSFYGKGSKHTFLPARKAERTAFIRGCHNIRL